MFGQVFFFLLQLPIKIVLTFCFRACRCLSFTNYNVLPTKHQDYFVIVYFGHAQ